MQLVQTLLGATAGGLLFGVVRVPGGLVVGAMVGAALVSITQGQTIDFPRPLHAAILIGIGAIIGSQIDWHVLLATRSILLPAAMSAIILIGFGFAVAFLLNRFQVLSPTSLVLATSPGALSAMIALSADAGESPVPISVFHVVRIVIVMMSMPIVLMVLSGTSR